MTDQIHDMVRERYAGWDGELGRSILDGGLSLGDLEARVAAGELDPSPRSGHQELAENVVNRAVWSSARD